MTEPATASLADRVLDVVAKAQRLPREKVTLDSSFEELGIDSLDGFSLIFALEEEFDLSIPDDAARGLATMRDLVGALEGALAAAPADGAPPAAEDEPEAG